MSKNPVSRKKVLTPKVDTATDETITVSSNTLFHFTRSYENLLGILQNNFQPRFCLEDHAAAFARAEVAFPMVCFCDLPLSMIGTHLRTYGDYGIGMRKSWGQENGVSPVLYAHAESHSFVAAVEIMGAVLKPGFLESVDDGQQIFRGVQHLISYLKPYEGRFWRNGAYVEKVRFYDEREWRFVPRREPDQWILTKEEFLSPRICKKHNTQVAKIPLVFSPDDIRYIIVRSEAEILPIVDAILKLKGSKYSYDDVRLLTTRVISAEQIREDF